MKGFRVDALGQIISWEECVHCHKKVGPEKAATVFVASTNFICGECYLGLIQRPSKRPWKLTAMLFIATGLNIAAALVGAIQIIWK